MSVQSLYSEFNAFLMESDVGKEIDSEKLSELKTLVQSQLEMISNSQEAELKNSLRDIGQRVIQTEATFGKKLLSLSDQIVVSNSKKRSLDQVYDDHVSLSENSPLEKKIKLNKNKELKPIEGLIQSSANENQIETKIEDTHLTPEVTVNKIINYEKELEQTRLCKLDKDSAIFKSMKRKDSYWENASTTYLKIENSIRENGVEIPTWEVAGPLHYGMSIDKMKTVIQQKFTEMVVSGRLMTEKSLMETQDRSTFYPEPKSNARRNDLTRIWGADFLKSNLQNSHNLDAVEHYLIIDDSVMEIEVQVVCLDYPVLSIVKNGYILSKKIEGKRAAGSYRLSSALGKVKYQDFSDPGNIICDSNNIGWVVDTERKSFDPPCLDNISSQNRKYLQMRFEILIGNRDLLQTFRIPVSDIGLYSGLSLK